MNPGRWAWDRARRIRGRIGHLAWHSLVLFALLRVGDLANLAYRFLLGRYHLDGLDFGALDPVFSVLTILAIPATIVFLVGSRSISRLRALGLQDACASLVRDLFLVAVAGSAGTALVVYGKQDYILERLHLSGSVYVHIMASMLVLAWWTPYCRSVIQGHQRYALTAVPSIVGPFAVLGLLFFLVRGLRLGLPGALLARAGGGAVSIVCMLFLLRGAFRGRRVSYAGELRGMGAGLWAVAVFVVASILLSQFDHLFVRNFLLPDSAGYGAVITVGQIPVRLMDPLVFVVFPLAAREHAGGRSVRRFARQALAAGALVTLPSVAVLWFAAEPLFRLWNPLFVPYSPLVPLFALAMGFEGVMLAVSHVHLARHHYRFLWWLVVPTALACAGLYYARTYFRIPFGLPTVLLVVTLARAVALLGCLVPVFGREKS